MLTGGVHLLIDGRLSQSLSATRLNSFLRHFPAYIHMHRFTNPMVYSVPAGCAGIVGIAESHIAVHVTGDLAWVDVFSCKDFDTDRATAAIQYLLRMSLCHTQVLARPMP